MLHLAKFSCRLAQTSQTGRDLECACIHDKIAYRLYKITGAVHSTTYKLAQLHSTMAGFRAAVCLCGYLFSVKRLKSSLHVSKNY